MQATGIDLGRWTFEGPYTNTASLRDDAGIYAILDHRVDGRWYVVDVGESEQVKSRVENHDRQGCWTRHRRGTLGVAVLYAAGSSGAHRRVVEREVRSRYSPPCGSF